MLVVLLHQQLHVVLSDAYKQLGDTSSALRLFRHSRRLYKHFHNPANWQLLKLIPRQWLMDASVWLKVIVVVLVVFVAVYAWK